MGGSPLTLPRHLLLIDDDPDIAFIVTRFFRGDVVRVCGTGRAGLEAVTAGPVDVLLCDLDLPDLDGVSLFEAICQCRPELRERTLFVSGGALSEEGELALALTGCPVLSKPFTLTELAEQVEQVHRGIQGGAGRRQTR